MRFDKVGYNARRLAQTPRTFSNWPELLRHLAGAVLGRDDEALRFAVRSGPTLVTPNVPGARLPMYEQFADDCYDVAWVLGPEGGAQGLLDVGSHVGAFTINLATRRSDLRVDCFEPSPVSAGYLRRNIDINGLADRVKVHEQAMAGEAGSAVLEDSTPGSVHNGLVRDGHRLVDGDDALGKRRAIEVETTTFDAAIANAQGPVDVVKMDCEGGEYELVYASSRASWDAVQRIVMEYHPVAGQSWAALSGWLADAGFEVVRHEPNGVGLGTAWLQRVRD